MEWRDLGRFAGCYTLLIVLDILFKVAFDWPVDQEHDLFLAGMATIVMAIRERK